MGLSLLVFSVGAGMAISSGIIALVAGSDMNDRSTNALGASATIGFILMLIGAAI